MKVLLSDGSGLTSRQLATILSRKGHEVHVLCPSGLALTRLTCHVKKVHYVPPFGTDPFKWFDFALNVMQEMKPDVFVCSQEQVALVSARATEIRHLRVRISVPAFSSLRKVMDKISTYDTLRSVGLHQPESITIDLEQALLCQQCVGHYLPAYIKAPIGTASKGVRFADSSDALRAATANLVECGALLKGDRLLVQKALRGPLLMIQAVFAGGTLLAWHACLRALEGPSGGAARKISLPLPGVGEDLVKLGSFLTWDGPLSMDAILVDGLPYYIDVNPRIVEPMNALQSGVDLVESLLHISTLDPATTNVSIAAERGGLLLLKAKNGREGVQTHQLLLALLRAVENGRLAVLKEAWGAALGRNLYADSTEELTPVSDDPLSILVLFCLVLFLVISGPHCAGRLDKAAVSKYALSPAGWRWILDAHSMPTTAQNAI